MYNADRPRRSLSAADDTSCPGTILQAFPLGTFHNPSLYASPTYSGQRVEGLCQANVVSVFDE